MQYRVKIENELYIPEYSYTPLGEDWKNFYNDDGTIVISNTLKDAKSTFFKDKDKKIKHMYFDENGDLIPPARPLPNHEK